MGIVEDLLDVQVPSNVRISPNGQQVVYSTRTPTRGKGKDLFVSALWLADVGKDNSARQITSGESNDTNPAWSADSKNIAFLSDREEPGRTCAIYLMSAKGDAEAYAITEAENERPIAAFQWSPNGKSIAFISADEKTSEERQRSKDKDDPNVWGENIIRSRLRVLDVATKTVKVLLSPEDHVTSLAWKPDSTQIAIAQSKRPDIESKILEGGTISIIDVETDTLTPVQHFGSTIENLTWIGNSLYFTGNYEPTLLASSIVLWSIVLEAEYPLQRLEYNDVGEISQVGSEDLVISLRHGTMNSICSLSGREFGTYGTNLTSLNAHASRNREDWAGAIITSNVGNPFEVYSVVKGEIVRLSNHGDILRRYEYGAASILECKTADNEETIDAIFYAPTKPKGANGSRGPHPTVVLVHGGPYNRSTNSFDPDSTHWLPLFLYAGYAVLQPNYRGGSGRGEKFAAYSRRGIGAQDYADVITLTQLAIEQGLSDKTKLLVAGHSHGGLIAYQAAVRNGLHGHGWKFQACIAAAGSSDPDTMNFTSDMGLTFQHNLRDMAPWDNDVDSIETRQRGSIIWTFKEAVAKDAVAPILIMHAELDKRVPFEQAVAARRAWQFHGKPFEFVSYPREGHGMVEYMHVKDRMERGLRWVNKYLLRDLEVR